MPLPEPKISWQTVNSTGGAAESRFKEDTVRMMSLIQSLVSHRSQQGQGLAEYALILALIAVLAIAAVTFLGGQINAILSSVGQAI